MKLLWKQQPSKVQKEECHEEGSVNRPNSLDENPIIRILQGRPPPFLQGVDERFNDLLRHKPSPYSCCWDGLQSQLPPSEFGLCGGEEGSWSFTSKGG
jgi:hypothetical protein